jgi:GxxExxY protein
LEFDDLSGRVIGCAIEVHRTLGPGLLESVYRRCLAHELRARGLKYETEKLLPVRYKDLVLEGDLRLDLLIEGVLVVELKAVENLLALHEAQLLTYMRLAGVKTGLLINFNSRSIKDGLKRLVL